MKTKTLITTLLVLCFTIPTQAQFFKKLAKKAEQAAERTVLNRTDKEVSKGTDKTIDGAMGKGDKKNKTIGETEKNNSKELSDEEKQATERKISNMFGGGNMEAVPDEYKFSYRANMEMTTNKEKMDFVYYFEPDQTYYANSTNITQQIMVMDFAAKMMVMFADDGKQRTMMAISSDNKLFDKYKDKFAQKTNYNDAEISPIGNKKVLGYNCTGYQISDKDGISKIWVTGEVPVGNISGMLNTDEVPTALPFSKKTMIMEMEYMPNKGKKDRFHMICTAFDKHPFSIFKKDYRSNGF